MLQEYKDMKKLVQNSSIYMFSESEYLAMVSNAERFAELVINFIG